MALYPLVFQPILKEKVWGGRSLVAMNKPLPDDANIGESWELADLSSTSASGGGGGAERSVVVNGPLSGMTLHQLMRDFGGELMGSLPPTDTGDFPLLVKYLDAQQNLSVQVHPSQEYADQHEDAFLKSEAWYIVAAEPEGKIYKGVIEGTTPQMMREAIENNTVEKLLIEVPVKPGDVHYLPSGTCHALGAGVLVAEVQTPSDTTFRVYDWGREGRELHIEQALQCIDYHPVDTTPYELTHDFGDDQTHMRGLVRCEYFRMEHIAMNAGYRQPLAYTEPIVWMVLEGRGKLMCDNAGIDEVIFEKGQTLLLPPSVENLRVEILEDARWIEVSFPQAGGDLLADMHG